MPEFKCVYEFSWDLEIKTMKMESNLNVLIEFYTNQKRDGMDFTEIRKELAMKNYDDETIKSIIRKIDNQILHEVRGKSISIKAKETYALGLLLMLGGGFITIATYFGIINIKGLYIISYGPIIGGYLLILSSRRKPTILKRLFEKKNQH